MTVTPANHASRSAGYLPNRYDGHSAEYHHWRESRLARHHNQPDKGVTLTPSINTTQDQSALHALCDRVLRDGFCSYRWTRLPADLQAAIARLNACLGLTDSDAGVLSDSNGLSLLEDLQGTAKGRFIPYTNKAMNWHTDGYYNTRAEAVRCFTLHCVQPAPDGGTLNLMDPELLLIALYDQQPQIVRLLAHPQAMTIPHNTDTLGHQRPDRSAALFFSHSDGALGTNFTTRTKNIVWRNDATRQAAITATGLINTTREYQHHTLLDSNQGIVTRNILHARSPFTDSDTVKRQMLRGRYHQIAQFNQAAFQQQATTPQQTETAAEKSNHVAR